MFDLQSQAAYFWPLQLTLAATATAAGAASAVDTLVTAANATTTAAEALQQYGFQHPQYLTSHGRITISQSFSLSLQPVSRVFRTDVALEELPQWLCIGVVTGLVKYNMKHGSEWNADQCTKDAPDCGPKG